MKPDEASQGVLDVQPTTAYARPARGASMSNVVLGAIGLMLLLWTAGLWAKRLALSARLGKCW